MRISDWSSDVCSSDLSGERSVRVVLQDQRGSFGNLQRIVDALFLAVGNTEENKRRALWMALVMPFHRHDFGRLMLKRVEPMHVAHKDLNGSDKGGHPHGHGKHLARARISAVSQQVPGRSEEHTSELQSLMRISYAVFCL